MDGEGRAFIEIENRSQADRPLPVPTLPAHAVLADGEVRRLATWCPWCEREHTHGPAGGGGGRGPHCSDDRASPFRRTGYRLDITRRTSSERSVMPRGLLVGRRALHRSLAEASSALSALVLCAVLGRDGSELETEGGTARLFADRHWLIEPEGHQAVEGVGYVQLAAKLYGISGGIVAVRLIEAASLDRLDERAAFELQGVIERWIARGAPSRPDF